MLKNNKYWEKAFPPDKSKLIKKSVMYIECMHGPWYPSYKYDYFLFKDIVNDYTFEVGFYNKQFRWSRRL